MDLHVTAQDHSRVRVLVAPIGSIGGHCYAHTVSEFEQLSPVPVKLPSVSEHRRLDLRFTKFSEDGENGRGSGRWDDFQLHRRFVAILGVAECEMLGEIDEINEELKAIRKKHETTLLDWRCIVFCPNAELEEAIKRVKGFHCILHDSNGDDLTILRPGLEAVLEDVASYLYLALDSRRHEFSEMKAEKMPLFRSPLDTESVFAEDGRQARKRCQARMNKHLGDLCLILGQLQDAFKYYGLSADQCKAINDWLWMGGAIEGQCNTAIGAAYPRRKDFVTVSLSAKRRKGSRKRGSDGSNDYFMGNEGVVTAYQNALMQYSKFHEAAVMEAECSFSATRHLSTIKKYIEAAEILQELVYIRVSMTEEQKVAMFEVMGQLFGELGYKRKSSFYFRLAAMHSVKLTMTRPNWGQAYTFLVRSLKDIGVDVSEKQRIRRGWPSVHSQLLRELIYVAKKIGKLESALNYSLLMLDSLYTHLTESDLKNTVGDIENLARQLESECIASKEFSSEDEEVNLSPLESIPTVRSLVPCELSRQHRPFSSVKNRQHADGPFIFSSLRMTIKKKEASVSWVQDCVAEVAVELFNPLPFEIKVEKMNVLTSGNKFEAFPSAVTLPPNCELHRVVLLGSPVEPGELQITGYSARVFGVENRLSTNCPVRIYVTPSLPLLRVFPLSISQPASSPAASAFDRRSLGDGPSGGYLTSSDVGSRSPVTEKLRNHLRVGSLILLDGEETPLRLRAENKGESVIEQLSLQLTVTDSVDKELVSWTISDMNALLPIPQQKPSCIRIQLRGHYPSASVDSCSSPKSSKGSEISTPSLEEAATDFTEITLKDEKQSPFTKVKQKMKSAIKRSIASSSSSSSPSSTPKDKAKRARLKFKRLFSRKSRDYSSLAGNQAKEEANKGGVNRLLDLTEVPPPCICQIELLFRYGCGSKPGGEVAGVWHREVACVLDVAVCPVVRVGAVDVRRVRGRQDVCAVELKVQSVSDVRMEMRCSVEDGEEGKACQLGPLEQDSLTVLIFRRERGLVGFEAYSEWLREAVRIAWKHLGGTTGLKGLVRLPHFELDDDGVLCLKPDPLSIKCRFEAKRVSVGNAVEFLVEFVNTSESPSELYFFVVDWRLTGQSLQSGRVAWIGAFDGVVGQLPPKEAFVHSCQVVFLREGSYELTVKCNRHDTSQDSTFEINLLTVEVLAP